MYQVDFNHPICVYFIGIGGISMSGLAEVLLSEGFRIMGSDAKKSSLTESLRDKGAVVHYGQSRDNITPDIDLVVYTAAVHEDNPEFAAAAGLGLPCLTRAQLLGQMMRNYRSPIAISGTHGKTTTTGMVTEILMAADTDPTISIGGILKSIHGNIRVGHSEIFVTEACEYTNSFLSFFPKIGMILNIEEDHLDFFKDLSDIRASFHRFASLLPEDGVLIINGGIENLSGITDGLKCRVITFGTGQDCDYSYTSLAFDEFARASFLLQRKGSSTLPVKLGVSGEHNVLNALAALALSDVLKLDIRIAADALHIFHGTDRRFEYKGTVKGITIIDDYAHHPTEITATLTAAIKYPHKTLWCIFQPHTYTRTRAFMKDFARALALSDRIILTDIYAARETDTLGISSETLQKEIVALGKDCQFFPYFEDIENFVLKNCHEGDVLITMGAGDVVNIGENLLTH